MFRSLFLVSILLMATPVSAVEIYAGAVSTHFGRQPLDRDGIPQKYQNNNPLLAVKHHSYIAAVFRNSYNDTTFLAGKELINGDWKDLQFSLAAAVTYGYTFCLSGTYRDDKKFCPVLIPQIAYTGFGRRVQPVILFTGPAASFAIKFEIP